MSKNWNKGEEITRVGLNNTGMGLKVVAQDPAALTLYVNAGVAIVDGITVKYDGGNSPSIAAPATNPRIDLIAINSAGVISLVAGTENASPNAPAYPSDKTVLAEIYCRVGMTSITDNDAGSGPGYIYRDCRPLGAGITLIASSTGSADAGKGTKTDADGKLDASFNSTDFGDGSDGDVTVSTTITLTRDMYYNNLVVTGTINTAGWRIFVKGTLSGNGIIQFNGNNGTNGGNGGPSSNNPGSGGPGGTATTGGYFETKAGGAGVVGIYYNTAGNNGGSPSALSNSISLQPSKAGGAGGSCGARAGGTGGTPVTPTGTISKPLTNKFQTLCGLDFLANGTFTKFSPCIGGNGGGSGGTTGYNSGGGGGGGAGGGTVLIVANYFTGTVSIKAMGGNGGNGGNGGYGDAGGGGGGAGGNGGIVIVIYRIKTWTGSYDVTGGTGGTGGTKVGTGNNGSNGNDGYSGYTYELKMGALL